MDSSSLGAARKVVKIVATICYFFGKMHQIRFRQRSPDPLAGFKGPTYETRERKKDGRKGQGMGENRGEGHISQARGGKGKGEMLLPGAERGWTRLHLFNGPQTKKV